jgi:hypothetical protein
VPNVLQTFIALIVVLSYLVTQLLYLGLQYALLLTWLAWALFGIAWKRTWPVLAEGAWAPVVLLSILVALVWGSLSPSSVIFLGFLPLGSFWWKLGAIWLVLALTCFCGWLQGLLYWTPPAINIEPPTTAADHGHGH